jgi:hypothetical protein
MRLKMLLTQRQMDAKGLGNAALEWIVLAYFQHSIPA